MEKRNIPIKNYFVLSILVMVTIILTFYFVSWYNASKEYRKENSVIAGVLSKIKIEEITNYVLDNPNVVIYMSSGSDAEVKEFENKFKKFILKHEISDDIVYLDTNTVINGDYSVLLALFHDDLAARNVNLVNKANILIVRDSKIIDILYKDEQKINESDMNQFLEMYEVLE